MLLQFQVLRLRAAFLKSSAYKDCGFTTVWFDTLFSQNDELWGRQKPCVMSGQEAGLKLTLLELNKFQKESYVSKISIALDNEKLMDFEVLALSLLACNIINLHL